MRPPVQWGALLLSLGFACAPMASAGEFVLTAAETQRVEARQVVIRSSLDSAQLGISIGQAENADKRSTTQAPA